MDKLDLTKKFKSYYHAKTKPEIVEIEPAQFLSIKGKGDPSEAEFISKIQALYATAYTIKFIYKSKGKDFVVPKLEGLWRFDESLSNNTTISETPKAIPRSEWQYQLLIRMPDYVNNRTIINAALQVVEKKKIEEAENVHLLNLHEGKCIQILHVGPFHREPETLQLIQDFSNKHQLLKNGLHHEIYLSDFRKTPPDKLKTILREPVR
ncbi:GyrI-like domain-containing protein [Chryseosolibacter indicus]|uniref:GyrI-like domain-containing protein n=1 Tax=Chryseosolibacter indicus TaxID=2782351 RepID=A0ABS5VSB6_9BACT|nr:GyrI-like domain-containing protein [Chryseosolibacter indicus]MBT1704325.1 GyrI-like domain-containing protein [Chryseosolibacter indicus]